MLDRILSESPMFAGILAGLFLVYRFGREIVSAFSRFHLDTVSQYGTLVDRVSTVVTDNSQALVANSQALARAFTILDRQEVVLSVREVGVPEVLIRTGTDANDSYHSHRNQTEHPMYNPENEPIYGVPPSELIPEIVHNTAQTLSQKRDWGHTALGIAELHDQGITGQNVVVAILDTGVNEAHPGLDGQVIGGQDFTGSGSRLDRQGHGSHCAGIVAEKNDSQGLVGVAYDARIWNGKVLSDRGSGLSSWIAAGIRAAVTAKADVISMSLGGPTPDADTRNAIAAANAAGVWVVAAAGNDGPGPSPSFPGNYPNVVCVAAVDQNLSIARFSSRNAEVDVAAPGVQILSTYLGQQYASLSGTSMATPYAAGVLALLRSEIKKRNLKMPTLDQVLIAIQKSSKDLHPTGRDSSSGWGLIQPKTLIDYVLKELGNQPPVSPPTPPVPVPTPTPTPKPIRLTSPELIAAGFESITLTLQVKGKDTDPVPVPTPKPPVNEPVPEPEPKPEPEPEPEPDDTVAPITLPIGLRVLLRVLMPLLRRIAERTQTPIDDLILKVVEVLFGLSKQKAIAQAPDTDWLKVAVQALKALLPLLKELAKKTETSVDDLILDVIEKLLTSSKSMSSCTSRELRQKAERIAKEQGLILAA